MIKVDKKLVESLKCTNYLVIISFLWDL